MSCLIVVIDDDDDDRELYCQAVREYDEHCECISFSNSQQALQALLKPDAVIPALIFIDYRMPLVNGMDCLNTLKGDQRYHAVKMVVLSTAFTDAVRSRLLEQGAYRVVAKPESVDLIVSQIKSMFEVELT